MDVKKLKEEQARLASKVITRDELEKIAKIAGCSQISIGDRVVSTIVVCDKDFNLIEKKTAVAEAKFPYKPEFMFYREGPAIAEAFSRLENKPDIILIPANGIVHPLRMGMASHLGVVLDIPTIGVSKKIICGTIDRDGKIEVNKEIRGRRIVTKEHANPLYVSPGHKVSLQRALEIVEKSIKPPHKLPEPLYLAKRINKKERERLANKS